MTSETRSQHQTRPPYFPPPCTLTQSPRSTELSSDMPPVTLLAFSFSTLIHWGKLSHPQLPRLRERTKEALNSSAQNSPLNPEAPTC